MDPPSPAILVTGGLPGEANLTCEVLRGDGSHWCSLPDLGQARHGHTQTGLVACGGEGALFSCSTFAQSAWHTSHSLPRPRTHHSAWSPAPGPAPGPAHHYDLHARLLVKEERLGGGGLGSPDSYQAAFKPYSSGDQENVPQHANIQPKVDRVPAAAPPRVRNVDNCSIPPT